MKQDTVTPAARALPEGVWEALKRLELAQGKHEHIRALIGQAETEKADSEKAHKLACGQFEANEAGAILDGTAKDSALRKAVMKHSEAIMVLNARIDGLEGRDQVIKTEMDGLSRDLALAEERWIQSETIKAREAYSAAVGQFVEATAVPLATGLALDDRSLVMTMKAITVPDPANARRNGFPTARTFRSSPAMTAVFEAFSSLRGTVKTAISRARAAAESKAR